ncbi:Thymidylate kinase [Nodularia spumigena CCY9414]|nr:Thymidylate kinase [Nodularia spumigena CCY9414]
MGGIYDHVGGGFHRYTVDPTWIVPHFEKMLDDNGQIVEYIVLQNNKTVII